LRAKLNFADDAMHYYPAATHVNYSNADARRLRLLTWIQVAMNIRRWHAYLGLLIAPSVLFFSLTGALQLFSLHEAHGSYQPTALVEKLSSVHKDQEFALGHHGPGPQKPAAAQPDVAVAPAAARDDKGQKAEMSKTLLKWYFLLVAVALTTSTSFGIWMGLTQLRRGPIAWTLLIVGTIAPVALLLA
jgi:hypothetical protein